MTVGTQEKFLEETVKLEEKYKDNEEKLNREMNKVLLLVLLKKIDSNVTLKDINNMHPGDFIFLVNKIWSSGRELTKGDESDFQIKK